MVITKLDRLSRNAHFLLGLQEAGVKFVAVDMPTANELTVGIMAVAQEERKAISARTKAALAAAKARGVKLGCPNGAAHLQGENNGSMQGVENIKRGADERAGKLADVVKEIQEGGATSLREIAEELNRRSITTARGGAWHASSVKNLLARIS